jgi:hypothetical protein
MKTTRNLSLFIFIVGCISACKKSDSACNLQLAVTTSVIASQPCAATGAVVITSPVGADYKYKLGNQSFQSDPAFQNLKTGVYIVTVKDASGCEAVKEIMIDTILQGPKFTQVFQILANRCFSCHSGNNPQAGLNFTNVCDIINHWQRIEARAIQGIPSPMPQAGLIPLAERNKIVEWINAGHSYEK